MTRKLTHPQFRMLCDLTDRRMTVWATDRTAIALEQRGLIERFNFRPSLKRDYCYLRITEVGRQALTVGHPAHAEHIGNG